MIVFDRESRLFSAVSDRVYAANAEKIAKGITKVGNFMGNHRRALVNAGTTAIGAGVGAKIAQKRAEKQALAAGATAEEAKRAGRKAALKGAGVGAAAGLGAGVVGQAGAKVGSDFMKTYKQNKSMARNTRGNLKTAFKKFKAGDSLKEEFGHYKNPVVNTGASIRAKFAKKS